MSGNLHAEHLAVHCKTKRHWFRKDCETCKTETMHHGWKCLTCGTLKVRQLDNRGTPSLAKRIKYKKLHSQKQNDRREHLKRMAEASRLKFEGPK
jgi:hypothetical protein